MTTFADPATPPVDLACPLCGYSLRGLTTPRCPECGYAFAWADLLDAKRDRHPWLFEHAARRPPRRWRDARAFAATYARTALPRRFWAAVTPANPVHVGRLVVYWAIAAVPLLSVFAIGPIRLAVDLHAMFPGPVSFGFLRAVWDEYADVDTVNGGQAVAVALAWPWLSLAALLVFQASMRRAKVGTPQVLRVVVYGCDFGLLFVVAAVVLYGLPIGPKGALANAIPRGPVLVGSEPVVLTVGLCLVVASYRLSVACGRYLRFPRPVLAVVASQAIVVLVVGIVLLRTTRLF